MTDFGHAIGVPTGGAGDPYGPYEPYLPYGHQHGQPPAADEVELGTAHARARALAETGNLTGARSMIEEALAIGELRLGPDHSALVPLMVDLATIARRLGNLTEARNQLRRAYAVVAGVGGADHPTALSIEGRIAAVAYRLGESTEVYDRHLADVGVRVLGPEHPAIRGALQRLGQLPPPPPREDDPLPLSRVPVADTPLTGAPLLDVPVLDPPPSAVPISGAPVSAAPVSGVPVSPSVPMRPSPYGPALEGDVLVARADAPTGRRSRTNRTNRTGLALMAALAAAVLIAGAVVTLQLLSPGGLMAPDPVSGHTSNPPVPRAPVNVRLDDRAGTVTLSWVDPSDGQVSFIVAGGLAGDELAEMASVPAGHTSATVYGTNPQANYCFTITAVWPDRTLASDEVCTHREPATPSATP